MAYCGTTSLKSSFCFALQRGDADTNESESLVFPALTVPTPAEDAQ